MKGIIISVICFVLLSCLAFAETNEPEGIMGMKWGQTIQEFKEKGMIDEVMSNKPSETGKCNLLAKDRRIGEISPVMILFGFYDNKFGSAYISFKQLEQYKAFRNALSDKYGKPIDVEEMKNYKGHSIGERCKWEFENVMLSINLNPAIVLCCY
jgi:hypothetical protein